MHPARSYTIQIKWEGSFLISDLRTLNNEEIDYGVYQIYGNHLVYGKDVLLYIGRANEQTFYTRISQHAYWLESHFKIYVGRFSNNKQASRERWSNEINLSEQLLINTHAPAYNTANINSINDVKVGDLHIMNLGEYKDLLPELSGERWIKESVLLANDIYRYNGE